MYLIGLINVLNNNKQNVCYSISVDEGGDEQRAKNEFLGKQVFSYQVLGRQLGKQTVKYFKYGVNREEMDGIDQRGPSGERKNCKPGTNQTTNVDPNLSGKRKSKK